MSAVVHFLLIVFSSSRKRSSVFSPLRASAHRCFLLFAQALIGVVSLRATYRRYRSKLIQQESVVDCARGARQSAQPPSPAAVGGLGAAVVDTAGGRPDLVGACASAPRLVARDRGGRDRRVDGRARRGGAAVAVSRAPLGDQ